MAAAVQLPLASWWDVPSAWFFVGAGLALATIVLVSCLRSRWRHFKPWKKCALLSLWVHVLLAYLTTVVQIASGGLGYGPGRGPGYGEGPPIQVALLSAAEITPLATANDVVLEVQAPETEPVEAPPLATSDSEAPVEVAEPTSAKTTQLTKGEVESPEPLEAPDLLPEPEPAKSPEPKAEDAPAADTLVIDDAEAEASAPEVAPVEEAAKPPTAIPPQDKSATASEPADDKVRATQSTPASSANGSAKNGIATAPAAAPPAAYADRFAWNRDQLVAGGGGNANTERAVNAALAWLAAAQSEDGRWDASRHGAGQERNPYVLGQNRGGAGAKADTGISGLALLTFLGAGHSHREGPYSVEIAHGLDFLRRSQQSNGNLCGDAELFAQMYCHSMASFALGEAYALTEDRRLDPLVRAAASYSLAVQHPVSGGWRYQPGQTGDTSQLGWQVMTLKSAQLGGVEIPDATWTRIERFLRQVERGQHGGLATYRPEEALPSRSMTAEALYCRQLITGKPDGQLSRAALNEAIDSLLREPPTAEHVNLYYWYYATLALHRAQDASPEAADAWRRWNEALTRTLLSTQEEGGSWPTTCLWAGYGGRVFTTSLAAMCLEVYYRYAPSGERDSSATDPSDVAQRNGWQSAPVR